MESNIEVYLFVIIFLLTIGFGVREILRDQNISREKRVSWIVFVVFFNFLAVILYLVLRLFQIDQKRDVRN
jgi:uncharacterized membrane protein